MGQIASAPCGAGFGPSTTCSAVSWEDVDVDDLQTQPIDIRHFLQRAEDEAKFWQEPQAAHVQPIRLLTPADRFLKHSTQKMKPRPSSNQDLDPTVVLSPDEACSMLPMLMDDRWIAPLVALLGGKDLKVVEMALAALSQLVDSEARQEMVIKSQGLSKLVHVVAFAHFQQIAFEALTAVCNGNGKACLDVASLGIIDTIFDVCKLKLSNADERKCSALQTLLVLVKHPEIKNTVAVSARVTVLVEFISCPNAPIAFYALSCLSELFACDSARKTAISSNVLTTLLRLLESPATANKTILLQTIYALSILATHESESFPIGESVGAISNAMDILRGALKRSRLASLVCMLVTGLAWKQPGTNKFQRALRERTSPNLFAILASLLIGGSTDVLCTAAIAVGALCHSCLENALAFAKLDVHTILAKLLPHKDDRVVSCAAMALSRFLTAFEMRAKAADLLWEPWQQEIAQSIAECTSIEGSPLDILYTSVIADRPEGNIASAFEIQTALDLFGFSGGKGRWTNATAVRAMLSLLSLSAGDLRLELLLFFQSCTEPIGGDIEPMDFCNLILNHDGLSLFVSLLQDATHLSHVCVVLRILLNLVFVYYKTPMPQPQPQFESMLRQIVRLVARTDVLDVHRAAIKLLEVATETKFCQAVVALNTLITADPNCIANLLFSQCQAVQRTSGIVISRLVRQFQGQWIPLSSVLVQLTSLLHSPSDDVAFAASHAWGSLLERIELCQTFSSIPDGVTFLLDQLETNRRAKYLIDAGRTLNRAAKHPAIQSQLLGHGFSVLERLIVHQLDALAHYAMLTLCQVGQNEALRPAKVSPSLIHQLNVFLTKSPDEDVNFTEPRRVSNAMDALCWIAEVCLDATTQQTALHAGLVDKVVACVLEKGPMHDVKLCAFSAIATLCSCDPTTREHILSEAVADAVLRQLDVQDDDASQDNEALVLLCLKILLQLLAAPSAQTIIAKSPRMGNIVQTLRFSSDKIRSLACQVIAVLSLRCDSVKADMCRLDINNILLNIVFAESNETKRINPSSRVQRHALHALSVLCEGVSPASKTNKQEIFDLPSATKLTDDMLSLPESEDAVESTALLCAVLANATYYSPRNQRLVFERQTEAKFIDLIMTSSTQRKSSYSEMLAIECMRALANLAAYPDNRKVMAQDNVFFNALHLALQSDVPQLHRFAALTIAQLCTGNDSHKVAMGAFNGLLPSLAERLGSKHPHVLENVCFAITKLGTYGGNKIIFGANLIFERLLPLVLHAEVAIQRMAMTAIAVLIEGNDRNKAALVECNAIPILCSLCQAHVNNRILEGAFQTLAELVSTQIVEVSKYINPAMLVQMLGSVNTRLFKAALQLLAHLTKESFNKVRFGEKACIEAVLRNLHAPQISNIPNDNRDEEENRSLLDSESDLATIELAATALANLSFEPANTSTIVETETEMSLIARLGEIMESAMVVAQELQRSPAKKKLSPIKKSSNQEDRVVVPLLASRPMQCQHILEQCSLILNNCAQEIQKHSLVTETIVSIVCRLLKHPSDLVKKCACFTLTSWCSKSPQHQEWVMDAEQNVLGTLIGMLNSSSPGILEATLWLLTKLSNYSDNYVKMAANDIVRILESTIFRFHTTIGSGVLDRAIRLLGNLALHDGVRKTIRGEALVAGPLSSILDHEKQLHETTSAASHAKNTARLISILLADDALKLFFPKKTISLLQTLYVVPTAQVKVRRNIILIFWLLSFVEEHRAVIANDEKGVVGRLVAALSMDEHELYIRAKLLSMFSLWSQVENICQLLYQRDIASSVLKYLVVSDLDCNRFAAVIVHHLSNLKDHVRSKLATEGTTEIVVSLLSQCVEKPVAFDPFAYHLAGILANLTVQDEVKSVVINVHGISTVLDFVRWKMDERIYDATQGGDALDIGAKILANLSFDEASKDELIHLGCLELVLQVLARGYASLAGIENYVLCLGNLSTVDQSIPRLENTSAIPILFGLLETYQASSPWITKCVIWAISNMALASSTSRQQIYAYPKGLDVVLSLLVPDAGKQTDTIVECAMSCVSSLVQEEEIAHALGVSSKIGNILRFLEPNVRQSLQRKAVKTIGCLAAHGHAIYIDDLSKTHTNLLSIATDSNLKSIAPSAIHALRRISHLRNESPQVLCANVHGIDTLLKLIQSDVISTVVDALHLIHHIATVTAPIMSNSEYFASKRTCTQATELLSSPNVEVQEGRKLAARAGSTL
ncbi:hypothetical protein Ae201684P_006463 [Aphanomyces euteiches]|nr:hypothetical protein Ae201684P_006463 [Aphanomyces euteiches]